jgi:hypothetical protein
MPQNFNPNQIAVNPQGYPAWLRQDASGNLRVASGKKAMLAITAATVVKTGPGRIVRVSILGAPSTFTINDCATVAAATSANAIYTSPAGGTPAGVLTLDCPLTTGLVVAAAGAVALSLVYS